MFFDVIEELSKDDISNSFNDLLDLGQTVSECFHCTKHNCVNAANYVEAHWLCYGGDNGGGDWRGYGWCTYIYGAGQKCR